MKEKQFKSFKEFYPFYLSQHKNFVCRKLHYTGSILVLFMLTYSLLSQQYILLWSLPLIGYSFAWVGHFFFEKNKPATFIYPLYSFIGDWVMLFDYLRGKKHF